MLRVLFGQRALSFWPLVLASLQSLSSCGGRTPLLREGVAPIPAKKILVTSLPPAARIEVIPIRRNAECVWLDGHYRPRSMLNQGSSTEWEWSPGAWVNFPDNCRYQPPRTEAERGDNGGSLVFFAPTFFDPESKENCPPPSACD